MARTYFSWHVFLNHLYSLPQGCYSISHSEILFSQQSLPETNRIAGALVMFPEKQCELFLHKIMVHTSCRGNGVGSALMRDALQRADAPVLLTVDPNNKPAVTLYENFGFTVRERIDGYYRPHEDRLIMVFTPE